MTTMINVNGVIGPAHEATISVLDHGFLFGEGVYEVCRTYHGLPFLFDRHTRRLRESAARLALPVPFTDGEIRDRVDDTVDAAELGTTDSPSAYVRLLLTRGVGEISYDPSGCPSPTFVVIAKKYVPPGRDVYELGVRIAMVATVRNHPASLNPLIKSNNLLNNALAMQEALRQGAFEALMHNHRGELAECSQSNLFVVKAGSIYTPPLDAGLLAGITRAYLFEIANDLGMTAAEVPLRDEDLLGADEAFLTSSTREIVPVVLVNDHRIGTGHPGPVTRALLDGYRQRVETLTKNGRDNQSAFSV